MSYHPEYSRQAEKFQAARRALMIPHSRGVPLSILESFREIDMALHRFDETALFAEAEEAIAVLREFLQRGGPGGWEATANGMTAFEQHALAAAVDTLANRFQALEDGVA